MVQQPASTMAVGHLWFRTRSLMAASMMRVREAMTMTANVTGPTCRPGGAEGRGAGSSAEARCG